MAGAFEVYDGIHQRLHFVTRKRDYTPHVQPAGLR
jgi:hypothetical protein